MKKFCFITSITLLTQAVYAQGPAVDYADDAFRYSDQVISGTARFRGMGGNHASLGGDASTIFGNPAGLGFYNRSEVSVSPSFNINRNESNYLGGSTIGTKNNVNVGQFSLVLAGNNSNGSRRWRRSTLGISYSQSLNFNELVDATGINRNNNSSFTQAYLNDVNSNNVNPADLDLEYDPSTNSAATGAGAAYQLFLINPTELANGTAGLPYTRPDNSPNLPLNQRATLTRTGAQSQWSIAYAGNLDDKLYIGGSLSLTRIRYSSDYTLREYVIGGGAFDNYSRNSRLDVTGNGINLSLGIIYKLDPSLQIGVTAQSPSWYGVREDYSQTLSARAIAPAFQTNGINNIAISPEPTFNYSLTSPFRASGGVTYFLGKGRIGLITATAEYAGYGGMRVRTTDFDSQGNTDFRNDVRLAVQDRYQSVVNFRAGTEIRAGLVRIRAGAGYLPTAYKLNLYRVTPNDRDKVLITGGLGIRNERFFADLSGSYYTFTTGLAPYELPNPSDTPTVLTKAQRTNVTLSIGTFF
ncbi:outer membrane protein transport protein [Spirosoma knui]